MPDTVPISQRSANKAFRALDINPLNGASDQIGGSVAAPVYGVPLMAGGDVNIIPDKNRNETYLGLTGNLGLGVPGKEIHVGWGDTAILEDSQINIFDIAEDICNKIAGIMK